MSDLQPKTAENRPILVADANDDYARHIERQLRRAGINNPVVCIKEGDDLHALLVDCGQTDGPKPCVLFLDPHMPGANGFDPIRWVKREKCLDDLMVVVFVSEETPEELAIARELGVTVFLKKNPHLGSLSEIVEYLSGPPPHAAPLAAPMPTVAVPSAG